MPTLTTIEFLLNLDEAMDIDLYDIPIEKIKEFSRVFETRIFEYELERWTTITKNKVKIRLNTNSK